MNESGEIGVAEARRTRATTLLVRVRDGQPGAADELVPLLYEELRSIAGKVLSALPRGTLNPTELVHEAYLKLIQSDRTQERDQEHFRAVAALAMRQAVIDHVRAKQASKRSSGIVAALPDDERIDEGTPDPAARVVDLLGLDEALFQLEHDHPRIARIIEMRFFGGLTIPEVARLLRLSPSMVEKESRLGWAFLRRELD